MQSMSETKRLSPIQEWLLTPPNQRTPLSWVKCTDESWALVPTCRVEAFKEQEAMRNRLAAGCAFSLQMAGVLILLLLPVTVLIHYFFR
jgi:hypothetical protein